MRSRMGAATGVMLAMTAALTGCRSCADDGAGAGAGAGGVAAGSASAGPTMPTGMLMPVARSDAGVDAGGVAAAAELSAEGNLRLVRGAKGGAWTELQIAKPGDTPDRFEFEHWRDDSWFVSLDAMTLMHEAFAHALPSFDLFLPRLYTPDALTSLGVWLDSFSIIHTGDIAATARQISALAKATAAAGKSLWVLGP